MAEEALFDNRHGGETMRMIMKTTPWGNGKYDFMVPMQCETITNGWLEVPEKFEQVLWDNAGFVNLTVEDGLVTAITPNVEAWEAWKNSLPAPIEPPAPPPTNTELAAQLAQSDDAAISLYEKQLAQDTINAGMDDALIALYERGGTK